MSSRGTRAVALYDPHPIWLEALEGIVRELGLEVAGKTTRFSDLVRLVSEVGPDLVVMEIVSEDGSDPSSTVTRLRELTEGVKIVVVSLEEDDRSIAAALEAGAAAYVTKTARADEVALAIRQVFEQRIYLANDALAEIGSAGTPYDGEGLTRREREILGLVADGSSNAGVARQLSLSEKTVKVHLSKIYRKLGVANRTEASRWAQTHGLLSKRIQSRAATTPAALPRSRRRG